MPSTWGALLRVSHSPRATLPSAPGSPASASSRRHRRRRTGAVTGDAVPTTPDTFYRAPARPAGRYYSIRRRLAGNADVPGPRVSLFRRNRRDFAAEADPVRARHQPDLVPGGTRARVAGEPRRPSRRRPFPGWVSRYRALPARNARTPARWRWLPSTSQPWRRLVHCLEPGTKPGMCVYKHWLLAYDLSSLHTSTPLRLLRQGAGRRVPFREPPLLSRTQGSRSPSIQVSKHSCKIPWGLPTPTHSKLATASVEVLHRLV